MTPQEKKLAVERRGQTASYLKGQLEPYLKEFIDNAFSRMLGSFEGGTLTDLQVRGILGEILGYKKIIRSFDTDIQRVRKLQGDVL